MKPVTLNQLLDDLAWPETMRGKLRQVAARLNIKAIAAYDEGGRLRASAFDQVPSPDELPANLVALWVKPAGQRSRTMEALELVAAGLGPTEAARRVGIDPAAVTHAIKRRAGRDICPHCNQVIRPELLRAA